MSQASEAVGEPDYVYTEFKRLTLLIRPKREILKKCIHFVFLYAEYDLRNLPYEGMQKNKSALCEPWNWQLLIP